ncbi:MAG: DUF4252 domain-containing protein [Flavobacterium sp.]|jgi:hypothetical protein
MKKLILIVTLLISTLTVKAQTPFDKFENQDDVNTIIINKKMFELIAKTKSKDKEKTQLLNLVKKLDQIKVFSSESVSKGKEMKVIAESYIKNNKLEELMRSNNGGKNVKIYVKNGTSDSVIKELFMYIEGDASEKNTVLLLLIGNLDIDEISELTETLNLPGKEEIKKASKKNN